MKLVYSLALLAVFAISTSVVAQETAQETAQEKSETCSKCPASGDTSDDSAATCCKEDGKCCKEGAECCKDGAKCCKDGESPDGCKTLCSDCAVASAMKKLPKMTFAVGTESTCCSESAAKMAETSSEPIRFVVADSTYDDKTEAYTALVKSTESFVDQYITPAKCEKTGTTSIAGKSCSCCVEAGKRAELVSAAVNEIKMTYKVGDEETCCANSAAALAEKSGSDTLYIVDGEETPCSLTARLKVATAKYEAAVKAIADADQTAAAEAESAPATSGT